MRRHLGNFAKFGLSSALTQGSTLIAFVIVSNLYGPVGAAQYNIVQITITTLASIFCFGLGYTVVRYTNILDNTIKVKDIVEFCVSFAFIAGFIALILLLLFSTIIAKLVFSDSELAIHLIISAIVLPFAASALVQQGALNGLQAYNALARASVMSSIATICLPIIGGWFAGALGAAAGFAASIVVRWLAFDRGLRSFGHNALRVPSIAIWRRIRHFAIPAGLAALTLMPSAWFVNALMIKHAGLESQGIVLGALTIKMAISFLLQQLSAVLLPQYLQAEGESRARHFRRLANYTAALITTAAFLGAITYLLRDSLVLMFGKGFYADPTIFALLLLSVVLEAASLPFSFVYARREHMWRYLLTFIYPKDIALVLSGILLIPSQGGHGFALAYSISAVTGLAGLCLAAAARAAFRFRLQ